MKRVVTSAALLLIIFFWSIAGGRILCRTADELSADIKEIGNIYDSGRKENASELSRVLENKWNNKQKLLSLMTNDEQINDLSFSIARIAPLIKDESDELSAELQNILRRLNRIKETETLHWYNLV